MLSVCTPSPTSENSTSGGPSGASSPKARDRNDAICARVTGFSGQNRAGSVAQPYVIPSSARRST